jgi:hypothetical protein
VVFSLYWEDADRRAARGCNQDDLWPLVHCIRLCSYRTESSTSRNQSGRFKTSRGLLPSGGPTIPSRCIISKIRAARP